MACIGYCVWDFKMCGGGLGNDVVLVSGGGEGIGDDEWSVSCTICTNVFGF